MAKFLECVCCKAEAPLECPVCGNNLCERHKICPDCDGAEPARVYGDRDEPTLVNVYDPDETWLMGSQNRAVDAAILLNKRGRKASVQSLYEEDIYSLQARQLHNDRVDCFAKSGHKLKLEAPKSYYVDENGERTEIPPKSQVG